ncbi:MAG: PEP/pyruvate-binding domain-containing protein [Acidimicrobiales bacterium]
MNSPSLADKHTIYVIGETRTRDVSAERVGAKAYNLMRMHEVGLPVPAGFVLDTSLCRAYYDAGQHLDKDISEIVVDGVSSIERVTDWSFGAGRRPLLVAVRSGAAVSMPGMLETILNVGLSDATIPGLLRASGDPVFVWDSYRRLIQSYGEVVDNCPAAAFAALLSEAQEHHGVPSIAELDVSGLQDVVSRLKDVYRSVAGRPFPQDPMTQMVGAVEAVMRSWNAPRAAEYRALEGLSHLAGTAVIVQAMVFGNLGVTSGSGVGFTRNPSSGEDRLYADFLLNAQGEDVVSGRQRGSDGEAVIASVPGLARELQTIRRRLEILFGDAQDFEFTVQEGKLWLLQTRDAKRTPWAALKIACDLVDEGLIEPAAALQRLRPIDVDGIARASLAVPDGVEPIGCGLPAGTGVAAGRVALSIKAAKRFSSAGDSVILVRDEASTEDIAGFAVCAGLVTARGARTSHAAVVARQLGVVCIVSCGELVLDNDRMRFRLSNHQIDEGDTITVDGDDGCIYRGELEVQLQVPRQLIDRVHSWRDSLTA